MDKGKHKKSGYLSIIMVKLGHRVKEKTGMEWIESIREAISYIEDNILEDLTIKQVADKVNISHSEIWIPVKKK